VGYLEACIGIFTWMSPLEMSVGQATPGLAALAVDSPMPKVALSRPPLSDLPLTREMAENPKSGEARPLPRSMERTLDQRGISSSETLPSSRV
jgi:hypothetical protein